MAYSQRLQSVIPPDAVASMGNHVIEISTNSFQRIYSDGTSYLCMPDKIDGLQEVRNAVKNDGKKFIESGKSFLKTTPHYFGFSDHFFNPSHYTDYVQIDISSAYWEIARKFGFISEETYTKYKSDKLNRNMALGTWAVQTVKSEYLEGKLISTEFSYKETRPLFFACAGACFQLMKSVLELSGAFGSPLFVWVDAIFVPKEFQQRVVEAVHLKGFKCTQDDISMMISDSKELKIYMKDDKVKIFSLPNSGRNNFDKLIS